MRRARALVFPSIYEGFGLPPLEAMALGVPVVAVQAGAIPEVVAESALLVPDGSPESLAKGIQTILSDSQLAHRLTVKGPQRAQIFSWHQHAYSVLNIYQQILER